MGWKMGEAFFGFLKKRGTFLNKKVRFWLNFSFSSGSLLVIHFTVNFRTWTYRSIYFIGVIVVHTYPWQEMLIHVPYWFCVDLCPHSSICHISRWRTLSTERHHWRLWHFHLPRFSITHTNHWEIPAMINVITCRLLLYTWCVSSPLNDVVLEKWA